MESGYTFVAEAPKNCSSRQNVEEVVVILD